MGLWGWNPQLLMILKCNLDDDAHSNLNSNDGQFYEWTSYWYICRPRTTCHMITTILCDILLLWLWLCMYRNDMDLSGYWKRIMYVRTYVRMYRLAALSLKHATRPEATCQRSQKDRRQVSVFIMNNCLIPQLMTSREFYLSSIDSLQTCISQSRGLKKHKWESSTA